MTRTSIRIAELMARLSALECERAAIVTEIETLRSAPSEQTAAINVIPSEKAGDLVGQGPLSGQTGRHLLAWRSSQFEPIADARGRARRRR
jgi:hypothetical protein